jgi:hypothetical protein
MQRSTILVAITIALASAAIAAEACSFPVITIAGDTSGSGGGTTSSATTGTGGAAMTSSSVSSTSSSSASAVASSSSIASSSSSSSGVPCTLDDDDDKVISWKCAPTDPTKDCADLDSRAFPDAGFQGLPITGEERDGLLWDFNCDVSVQKETTELNCGLGNGCDNVKIGFNGAVACGQMGVLGTCGGALCSFAPSMTSKLQRCK